MGTRLIFADQLAQRSFEQQPMGAMLESRVWR